ncbi:Nucleotide-binding universal stress protein, UspA family [Limimonas halophila]|uniref:Nucleotide-binding universal stress protein, UspA family n=1 Tax=Limimonas halophila TaxID=1082479 RepID=A0A1G7T2K1_9PROT|nr:universal stress protein [Limimonas halophila]SDG28810.1 Nucleotide-binding universal stress protein, UspA family [Limimonas halophila]
MTIRSILCVVDGTDASAATLGTALTLARQQEAYVEALHVEMDPRDAAPLAADGATSTMIQDIMDTVEEENRRRSQAAREVFRREAEQAGVRVVDPDAEVPEGVATGLRTRRGREHEVVAARGMVFDLVAVPPRRDGSEPPATATLESAIMETGRPTLVSPGQVPAVVGKHVAVAWRATVPGVHALQGSLPLLKAAASVSVITVDEGHSGPAPAEVARYLAHHGVHATPRAVEPEDRDVGQAVLEETEAAGADLLVMGAYAHSRLRQLILGGVTSTVLRSAAMPLVLAH